MRSQKKPLANDTTFIPGKTKLEMAVSMPPLPVAEMTKVNSFLVPKTVEAAVECWRRSRRSRHRDGRRRVEPAPDTRADALDLAPDQTTVAWEDEWKFLLEGQFCHRNLSLRFSY